MGAKIKNKFKRKRDESEDQKPLFELVEPQVIEYVIPQNKLNETDYTVHYQLELSEDDYYKVQKFLAFKDIDKQYTSVILTLLKETHVAHKKWTDFSKDLRAVSRGVPNVCFKVNCHGEDGPYELWSAFAMNGNYYDEHFEVEFPEFDYAKLKGVGEN